MARCIDLPNAGPVSSGLSIGCRKDNLSHMSSRWLLLLGFLSPALAQEESVFDKAARAREAARQRALDRGPRTAMPAGDGEESVFEKMARAREVARQHAFDRGQRTALPAAEERESIGKLETAPANAVKSADGKPVNQGAPAAAVYNRVMETARHFKHYNDPKLRNANDTFTDSPEMVEKVIKEAQRLYPDLLSPQSAFAMRHAAINRWVDSRQPPLAKDARRVLLIAHMVSLELTGGVRTDKFGLGQIPKLHQIGQRPPAFIKRNNFEIEVQGDVALLPDGLRGTVKRGKEGRPDVIQWLDAEGSHSLLIPDEDAGLVELFFMYSCHYQRTETLDGNYRLRFTP